MNLYQIHKSEIMPLLLLTQSSYTWFVHDQELMGIQEGLVGSGHIHMRNGPKLHIQRLAI